MVAHGRDGWVLDYYDWDPETGVATLIYERIRKDTGEVQTKTVTKVQHDWYMQH